MSKFNLSALSEEERIEFDDMMHDAVMKPDGDTYTTGEIGSRLHQEVATRIEDGCAWAEAFQESASVRYYGSYGKRWAKSVDLIETPSGDGKLVSKSARASVRKRTADGVIVHQLSMWEQLSADELVQIINRDVKMIHGIKIEVATAQRLLNLCRQHGVDNVTDALDREGQTLQSFLDADEVA